MKTTIECRHQWISAEGVIWSRWYPLKYYTTREEAEADFPRVSSTKEINKLKFEYRIG